MNTPDHPTHGGQGLSFERLVFFSDAVFAIAITLLVLDLKLPPEAQGSAVIQTLLPKLLGFGISFFVIGIYWLAHHRLFATIWRQDGLLRWVNLVFLAAIAFLPFPTSLVTELERRPWQVMFYALSVAAVGLLMVVLILVARRPMLMRAGETRGGTARFVIRSLAAPLVFIGTAFVAPRNPSLAMSIWIVLYPVVLVADRLGRWVERRVDAAQAHQAAAVPRPSPAPPP